MKPDSQENRLDGRVIIVTGSTSGIGRAIALRAAELGAAGLIITGRNAQRGQETVDEIAAISHETGTKSQAIFVPAELTDPTACRAIVKAADDVFGRVDGLVNAAGRGTRGRLENTTVALWDEMIALHSRAPFLLIQETAKIMRREQTPGAIVNIGSIVAHGGTPDLLPYSVSKGALVTLTRNTAHALKRDHIRVNCLNIGWTATEQEHIVQTETGQPENWLELADATRPLGRLLRPQDIAPMVTFLLSDQTQMITGSIFEWDQTITLGPQGS